MAFETIQEWRRIFQPGGFTPDGYSLWQPTAPGCFIRVLIGEIARPSALRQALKGTRYMVEA